MARMDTLEAKVLARVLKRQPKTAREIAQEIGFPTHHPIALPLSNLVREGKIVATKTGRSTQYTKA